MKQVVDGVSYFGGLMVGSIFLIGVTAVIFVVSLEIVRQQIHNRKRSRTDDND